MERIKQITEELLSKLGVASPAILVSEERGVWKISIESDDEAALVGREGEKFEAISHILKRMLAKELGEDAKIALDVNGMRAKKEEEIKAKAGVLADRARAFKIDVEMDPMSSYERMVVHSHLEGSPNIKTESLGEAKNRHIIIKYVE
ncbi:MAG: R3H domain-containing nucleic acid-binding protein [Patescibacteria group bacterium]